MSGEFSGDVAVIGRARPARKGLSWGPARDTPPGPSANAWTQPCRLLPHPARTRRRARLGTHSPQKSREHRVRVARVFGEQCFVA